MISLHGAHISFFFFVTLLPLLAQLGVTSFNLRRTPSAAVGGSGGLFAYRQRVFGLDQGGFIDVDVKYSPGTVSSGRRFDAWRLARTNAIDRLDRL